DEATRTNSLQVNIPYVFGILGTRSFTTEVPGINELTETPKRAS
ncbi:hypothetical protein EVA_14285, partial [gut metagenome]